MNTDTVLRFELSSGETTPYVYLKNREVGIRVLAGEVEVSVGDDNIVSLEAHQDTETDVMTRTSLDVTAAQHQLRNVGVVAAEVEITIVPPLDEGNNPYAK